MGEDSRFFLCALWILLAIILSLVLIWRNEGSRKSRIAPEEAPPLETPSSVNMEDTWKSCYESVRPVVLLRYRLIALVIVLCLFMLILCDDIVNGEGIFLYYTRWTSALVLFYFLQAFLYSMDFCWCRSNHQNRRRDGCVPDSSFYDLQILYQMCAGAIILNCVVFWLVLYPFVLGKDFKLNLLLVCMPSVNAVTFLGDLILNNMKFPFFRIAYFLLFTCTYVIFQWIRHVGGCPSREWPYPIMDLSSNVAPLWYMGIGLLHLPCYGLIWLIVKAKLCCLKRSQATSSNVT